MIEEIVTLTKEEFDYLSSKTDKLMLTYTYKNLFSSDDMKPIKIEYKIKKYYYDLHMSKLAKLFYGN